MKIDIKTKSILLSLPEELRKQAEDNYPQFDFVVDSNGEVTSIVENKRNHIPGIIEEGSIQEIDELGQYLTDAEIERMEQGQKMTDIELRILSLEASSNV